MEGIEKIDNPKPSRLTKEQLEDLYIRQRKSCREISEEVGYAKETIGRWIKKYKIKMRNPEPPRLTKEQLEELYLKQGKGCIRISGETGYSPATIKRWIKKYKIKMRSIEEAKLACRGVIKPIREQLEEWYLKDKKTMRWIAEKVGVTGGAVVYWLKKYDIPVRGRLEAALPLGLDKRPTKEQLEQWYLKELLSTPQIAKKLGVCKRTIILWLKDARIKRRTSEEAILALKGIIKPIREQLEEWYLKDKKTMRWIAEKVGVSEGYMCKLYDILPRPKGLP